jgi:serine/threonine protein kinase/tetratricopeptide (TPR) repeat protein
MPDSISGDALPVDALAGRLATGLAGRYRIIRELGQGGMAVVYLATDLRHDRQVAIKVLRPELASSLGGQRFLREIGIAASLTHPHVLGMHDSGEIDSLLYYVMPFITGETLRQRLERERHLAIEDAIRIAIEVAEGLQYAHEAGVIHRDIKPENILFSGDHAVIADFGVGRALGLRGGTLTEPGLSLGTPAYMSPEQGCNEDLDARSDIYALGCLAYEMLVGEPPFTGATPQMVIARHVAAPVPSIRTVRETVPLAIEAAVHRALAKLPVDRFPTAGEFAAALRTTEAEASGAAPPRRASDRTSIVVLPFTNLSPGSDTDYLSDGIADGILTDLSGIGRLGVISSTSAMQLKGTAKDVRTIGRELGVRYVLEGSLRASGRQIRITAKLVDAGVDELVWASKFTGTFEDVLDLEEQVSRAVIQALELTVTSAEDAQLARHPVPDARAYEYYLRGRQEMLKFTADALERALGYLTKGLEILGDNVAIHYAIGAVHFQYLNAGISSDPVHVEAMGDVAERMAAIDPASPHLARMRGLIALLGGDTEGVVREFSAALAADPNDADALLWLSIMLGFAGHTEAAWPKVERLLRLDPLTAFYRMLPGFLALMQGDLAAASGPFEDALAHDPTNPVVRQFHGQILVMQGRHDAAREAFRRLHEDAPDTFFAMLGMLFAHTVAGDTAAATAALTPELREAALADPQYAWSLAQCAAQLGDVALGLEALRVASTKGFWNAEFLARHDPLIASLRGAPEFDALLAEMRRKSRRLIA